MRGARRSYATRPGAVAYPKGRWVYPRPGCGPLTVFATYEAAEKFIYDDNELVFFAAFTSQKAILKYLKYLGACVHAEYVIVPCVWQPWNEKLPRNAHGKPIAVWDNNGIVLAANLPRGTRLARAVKCLE
ncbi:MAG: hypothetical protein NZ739_11865 [Verrucomicrobiae bacterium]|nr:hypothetical protein [Verrucomicrobiae bacterium]